jgi:ferredoxin--NADP+ reductase
MVSCDYDEHIEFLSIVVPGGELTSSLSTIKEGDQVLVDKRGLGYLTVDQFQTPIDTLYLLATGTGIAPFISIIRSLDILERCNKICLIHSVRETSELVYKSQIEQLYDLRYIPIVTRDKTSPYYNTRIPAYLETTILPSLNPNDKFMLCGNPDMVRDTRALLEANGINVNRGTTVGRYVVENAF